MTHSSTAPQVRPELPKPYPRRVDVFKAECASDDGWHVSGCYEAVVAATEAHWASKHPAVTIWNSDYKQGPEAWMWPR
jgi:hypothetical protein